MIQLSLDSNRNAFLTKEIQDIIDQKNVDVVITTPIFGNEAVYYLNSKTNATLALFITAPFGMTWIN